MIEIVPSTVLLNAGEKQTLVERGSPLSEMIVVVAVVVVVVRNDFRTTSR